MGPNKECVDCSDARGADSCGLPEARPALAAVSMAVTVRAADRGYSGSGRSGGRSFNVSADFR